MDVLALELLVEKSWPELMDYMPPSLFSYVGGQSISPRVISHERQMELPC